MALRAVLAGARWPGVALERSPTRSNRSVMASLSDLTLADIEAAISDAEIDSEREHGIRVAIGLRSTVREGHLIVEAAASTPASCIERTIISDEVYFSTRAMVDQYLSSILSMLCRSAVEHMDISAGCRIT